MGGVRTMPCRVQSKTQARMPATGSPTRQAATIQRRTSARTSSPRSSRRSRKDPSTHHAAKTRVVAGHPVIRDGQCEPGFARGPFAPAVEITASDGDLLDATKAVADRGNGQPVADEAEKKVRDTSACGRRDLSGNRLRCERHVSILLRKPALASCGRPSLPSLSAGRRRRFRRRREAWRRSSESGWRRRRPPHGRRARR